MVSFTNFLLACAAASSAFAAPGVSKRQNGITPNEEGTHDGYFFSWWSDGQSPVTYTNTAGGSYQVQWSSGGNLVGGKGWMPGTRSRVISYEANWQPTNNGNSYLTIYGWTRNPLVEYYVVESHGEYNPGGSAEPRGSVEHDGSTYQLYESTRVEQPSIDGTATFQQYWAIRDQHRQSGTVDMGVFFAAWEAAGMPEGTEHYYQIVATEAYNSAGQSSVTVTTPA